ncbi:MAG: SEC-C metal-binding domain-containing protein [Candidatus Hydrothermarchaeaceae archaeon]
MVPVAVQTKPCPCGSGKKAGECCFASA